MNTNKFNKKRNKKLNRIKKRHCLKYIINLNQQI